MLQHQYLTQTNYHTNVKFTKFSGGNTPDHYPTPPLREGWQVTT